MIDENKRRVLFKLLDEAEELASQFTGGYSNQFLSAEEFHSALAESIVKFKSGDNEQVDAMWLWFAPTCSWDNFIRLEGMVLGNEIFEILDDIKRFKQSKQ